jgi:LPXTG-site transpeptidase (sortase) family protein
MRSLVTLLGILTLVVAGCSTATDSTTTTSVALQSTTSTTTTTTVPPTASSELSPLASLTRPLGSAAYDPADHVDGAPVPVALSIPVLGIEAAPIIDVGVADDGELEIPGADAVGWYRFGPRPGDAGSAVLAAHIAFNRKPGVFRNLVDTSVGDRFSVEFDDGSSQTYEIVEEAQYDKQELPFDRVFAKGGAPVVTLITCGGEFNRSLRSYEDNIVAYAVPVADEE